MRVAIVDDNAADRDWLAGQVEALLARRGLEGTVFPFSDGEGGDVSAVSLLWDI